MCQKHTWTLRIKAGPGSISTQQGQLAAPQRSQLIVTHLKMQTMSQINGQYTFNPLLVGQGSFNLCLKVEINCSLTSVRADPPLLKAKKKREAALNIKTIKCVNNLHLSAFQIQVVKSFPKLKNLNAGKIVALLAPLREKEAVLHFYEAQSSICFSE